MVRIIINPDKSQFETFQAPEETSQQAFFAPGYLPLPRGFLNSSNILLAKINGSPPPLVQAAAECESHLPANITIGRGGSRQEESRRKASENSAVKATAPAKKAITTVMPKTIKANLKKANTPVKAKAAVAAPAGSPYTRLPVRARQGRYSDPIDLTDDSNFYQSGTGASAAPPSQQNLSRLFDQYRDRNTPDKIGIEGAQKYLTDLGVELDEVVHLALCELLQCPSIGEFDREPFISGWRSLSPNHSSSPAQSYDTIARQSAYISTLRRKLVAEPSYFKQVYRNAFKLAKPENQKSVPMDSGMDFWNMFFRKGKGGIEWNSSRTKWLDMWLEFYEKNSGRPVNKDLWNMVGELVIKIKEPDGENLEWWTEDGAWPMAVDDFIASIKAKTGKEGESMDIS